MYGLLAICSLFNELTTFDDFNGKSRKVRLNIFLDSKSTIDRVQKHWNSPMPLTNMLAADMDIELQILEEIKELETKGFLIPYFMHVKAHQDNSKSISSLSREAQLNVEADRLATTFQKSKYIRQQYVPPLAVKATLFTSSVAVASKYKECLCHLSDLTKSILKIAL